MKTKFYTFHTPSKMLYENQMQISALAIMDIPFDARKEEQLKSTGQARGLFSAL